MKISFLSIYASIDVVGTLVSLDILTVNEFLFQLIPVLLFGLRPRLEALHELPLKLSEGQFHDDCQKEPKEQR